MPKDALIFSDAEPKIRLIYIFPNRSKKDYRTDDKRLLQV